MDIAALRFSPQDECVWVVDGPTIAFGPASEARRCGCASFFPATNDLRYKIKRAKLALRAIARGFCGRIYRIRWTVSLFGTA